MRTKQSLIKSPSNAQLKQIIASIIFKESPNAPRNRKFDEVNFSRGVKPLTSLNL